MRRTIQRERSSSIFISNDPPPPPSPFIPCSRDLSQTDSQDQEVLDQSERYLKGRRFQMGNSWTSRELTCRADSTVHYSFLNLFIMFVCSLVRSFGTVKWTDWDSDQQKAPGEDLDCVLRTGTGTWQMASCLEKHYFLCEKFLDWIFVVNKKTGACGRRSKASLKMPVTKNMDGATISCCAFLHDGFNECQHSRAIIVHSGVEDKGQWMSSEISLNVSQALEGARIYCSSNKYDPSPDGKVHDADADNKLWATSQTIQCFRLDPNRHQTRRPDQTRQFFFPAAPPTQPSEPDGQISPFFLKNGI
ncbi:hypothetical protein PoB_000331300 [Plakobranchus ocellatus]|uniref:C-type lectin domain-containing protein n=1 Tax=Plakobranchus ocellatus TaxID=259542 RepID=A0AAV3Y3M1_9GAST|nr:hypothetical protein PoB_000331300 [Plakobranchus ocellatus]